LLFTGDDDEVFMTRNLNVTPNTKEQHLIAGTDCAQGIVLLNRTTDGHKALRGLSATAELLVSTQPDYVSR